MFIFWERLQTAVLSSFFLDRGCVSVNIYRIPKKYKALSSIFSRSGAFFCRKKHANRRNDLESNAPERFVHSGHALRLLWDWKGRCSASASRRDDLCGFFLKNGLVFL